MYAVWMIQNLCLTYCTQSLIEMMAFAKRSLDSADAEVSIAVLKDSPDGLDSKVPPREELQEALFEYGLEIVDLRKGDLSDVDGTLVSRNSVDYAPIEQQRCIHSDISLKHSPRSCGRRFSAMNRHHHNPSVEHP